VATNLRLFWNCWLHCVIFSHVSFQNSLFLSFSLHLNFPELCTFNLRNDVMFLTATFVLKAQCVDRSLFVLKVPFSPKLQLCVFFTFWLLPHFLMFICEDPLCNMVCWVLGSMLHWLLTISIWLSYSSLQLMVLGIQFLTKVHFYPFTGQHLTAFLWLNCAQLRVLDIATRR